MKAHGTAVGLPTDDDMGNSGGRRALRADHFSECSRVGSLLHPTACAWIPVWSVAVYRTPGSLRGLRPGT